MPSAGAERRAVPAIESPPPQEKLDTYAGSKQGHTTPDGCFGASTLLISYPRPDSIALRQRLEFAPTVSLPSLRSDACIKVISRSTRRGSFTVRQFRLTTGGEGGGHEGWVQAWDVCVRGGADSPPALGWWIGTAEGPGIGESAQGSQRTVPRRGGTRRA